MKSLLVTICILGIVGMMIGTIAEGGETVTATVTIGTVSVTVSPTSFGYGSVPYSGSKESFDSDLASHNISATVGTAITDLDIKGANTADWALDTVANIGANKYAHTFGVAADETTKVVSYDSTALTTTFDSNYLVEGAAGSSVTWFGLKIYTPSSGVATVQSAAVTLQASWGG